MNATYLGDGVYVSFDGYQIWLDTRAQFPVNRIALEPEVYAALLRYVEKLHENDDPAPYCQYCGAKRKQDCDCGPIAENN